MRGKIKYFQKRTQKQLFLKWAINENNELVHISTVKSGLACNCRCPKCGEPLIARKGKIKVWHFAHVNADCQGACQTSLHILVKDVISECEYIILDGKRYPIDEVYLEKSEGDYIPDVTIISNGVKYHIEVYVTHKVDDLKILKLFDKGITTFEIDLSKIDRDIDKEFLRKFLTDTFDEDDYMSLDDIEKNKLNEEDFVEIKTRCINNTNERKELVKLRTSVGFLFTLDMEIKCPLLESFYINTVNPYECCFGHNCPFVEDVYDIYEDEKEIFDKILEIEDEDRRNRFIDVFDRWALVYRKIDIDDDDAYDINFCNSYIHPDLESAEYKLWLIERNNKRNELIRMYNMKFKKEIEQQQKAEMEKELEEKRLEKMSSFEYKPVNIWEI